MSNRNATWLARDGGRDPLEDAALVDSGDVREEGDVGDSLVELIENRLAFVAGDFLTNTVARNPDLGRNAQGAAELGAPHTVAEAEEDDLGSIPRQATR